MLVYSVYHCAVGMLIYSAYHCAVGMLIELMAGKAAAVKACCYDATPFSFTEDDDPITYFGQCLQKGQLLRAKCDLFCRCYVHHNVAAFFALFQTPISMPSTLNTEASRDHHYYFITLIWQSFAVQWIKYMIDATGTDQRLNSICKKLYPSD